MVVTLYEHQQKAVDELSDGKILYADVGLGKTMTALWYFYTKVCKGVVGDYGSMRDPTDLYIVTTAKKRDDLDWQRDCAALGLGKDADVSAGNVQVTVLSWNQLPDYLDVEGAYFIFDEQRLVGSGSWVKSFLKIAQKNRWIMLSATPGDTWMDYIPVFIANGFYKNRTEFIREHVVFSRYSKFPKVERYLGTARLDRLRDQILVLMLYDKHTVHVPEVITVDYDVEKFRKVMKKRWHVYEDRPLRDIAELFSVMRKVVNSDSSRLACLENLLFQHPRLIVFYNFDYELEILRGLATSTMEGENGSCEKICERSLRSNSRSCKEGAGCLHQKPTSSTGSQSILKDSTDPISNESLRDSMTPRTSPLEKNSSQSSDSSLMSNGSGLKILSRDTIEGFESCQTNFDGTEIPVNLKKLFERPLATKSLESSLRKTSERLNGRQGGLRIASTGISTGPASTLTPPWDTSNGLTTEMKDGKTFALAEWNGHKHEPIPKTDRWVYLVQYAAGSEGWNCIETDTIVFYSLTYSFKHFKQSHGRIDRINTPFKNLYFYYFVGQNALDKGIWNALKKKKNFNELKFVDQL